MVVVQPAPQPITVIVIVDIIDGSTIARTVGADRFAAETFQKAVRVLVDNQLRAGADASRADAELARAKVNLARAQQQEQISKAALADILGIADTSVEVSGGSVLGAPPNGSLPSTALTAHLAASAGMDAQLGGNIGTAILSLAPPQAPDVAPTRIYVIECSSYQIDLAPSLDPSIGILINLSEDHLDRHGTMAHYADVKARLVAGVPSGGTAIVGVDDEWCCAIADRLAQSGKSIVRISVRGTLADGIYADGPRIVRAVWWPADSRAARSTECVASPWYSSLRPVCLPAPTPISARSSIPSSQTR